MAASTVVRLGGIMGNILEINEVDIFDGIPVLDIKPIVPLFDNRDNAKVAGQKDLI